ncbi:hypothetical protein KJ909_03365, partial [Patescibacteria group bacterium]|nr:hypothetical protein [Patescibacteria group bacterium]
MADLPRIFLLWLSSFVLPVNFLRYFYIFLCLALGPLGIYFFLKYVFEREKTGFVVSTASFLGALFYLLNLGTLQHFFVPFEMFTAQFAFLPWLFLFALKYLREKRRKNLAIFAILTVVAGPQAYAATLFYAYLGALVVFVFSYRRKKGLILILLTLFLNAYWLLPNLYSVIFQSQTVINSNINRLFTPEAILRSFNYENLADILIHKNFLFGWQAFDFGAGRFVDLMGAWSIHPVLYPAAVLSLLGVAVSLFKRDRVGYSLFFIAVYAFLFLTGGNFFKSGVLKEALRMPFTKFSIIFLFSSSFFFGYFFSLKKNLLLIIALVVSLGLIFSVLPMFQGQLISPVVRTKLPSEYLKLFGWFNDKEGRVALLPLNSLWGWEYHSWEYEGSGFLGFGLANPLLVRDYDRWSSYNETFFSE